MNVPGVSLFQGAESIKVNTSIERAEEEEELEDQRRRHEELGNILQNAFGDLIDDETTIDSTTHFPSEISGQYTNQHQRLNNNNVEQRLLPPVNDGFEADVHHLKMLLESRTNELENIKQLANDEYKKRDEYQKRLAIAEAELDRALATKKNTHELLVESKEKCSNLENTIVKLRNEKKELEAENNTLLGKLETSQTLLADVQRKYDMVERDICKNNERSAEIRRKQMEERHRAEIDMMQQQMDQLTDKLDKKTSELEHMNTRYAALQSSHEVMLVDKASKINELNNALNETQKRCDALMSKQDYFQENIRLQRLVANLQEQILTMETTINKLNERLECTTAELDVMDSLLHQYNLEDTPTRKSGQMQRKVVGSTPMNTIDRAGNLKDELFRALANVKTKRDEVHKLQTQLEEKNAEIRVLKDDENKALVQISTLTEEKIRLENRLRILQEEFDDLRTQSLNKTVNNNQIQQLTVELNQLKQQKENLECESATHEAERKKLDLQLKNVEVDLEELKQEHESMKLNYEQVLKENQNLRSRTSADNIRLDLEKHKFLLKDAQAEVDRLKNLYIDISNEKESLQYEVEQMRKADNVKDLHAEREKVANLQRALQLAEVKSSELSKLLETEKLCHERDVIALREKFEKDKTNPDSKTIKDNANNCTKCMDYLSEVTKFEIQNLKLANANAVCKKEIDDLDRELTESKNLIAELREKLKLSEHQEALIKELKVKAHQFEEYIKVQSSASEKSISPKKRACDKSVSTSPEVEKNEIKKIESRIRDEMAKIFANELKRYRMKLQQIEEKNLCLQSEYQHMCIELQKRTNEVELLKQAILAEREKMAEILREKDEQCEKLVQKHAVMLHKCREELKAKNQKITELTKELSDRQTQIEAERQSMKAVMVQWEQQRKDVDGIEREWKEKLQALKKAHENATLSWQTKYNSAKRTAANYKRYAEDKETHMLKEYDRLKYEYDASLAKIEVRMKEALERKNLELRETIGCVEKRHGLDYEKENKAQN